MKKRFVRVVALLVFLLSAGANEASVAQTSTASASTSVGNNAVFLTKVSDFVGGPAAVTRSDVETGGLLLGSAQFNVDVTSPYGISALVTTGTLPGASLGADCATSRCPFGLSWDNGTTAAPGDVGVSVTGNPATSGSGGKNFTLLAGLCFKLNLAGVTTDCIADGPNGTYTFVATITVTD